MALDMMHHLGGKGRRLHKMCHDVQSAPLGRESVGLAGSLTEGCLYEAVIGC